MTDKPTPTDAATPECLTCSDHGAVGNSGFDYKTAADFLSGKTVSDEALRKFVAASRGAHDARAALHAKMLSLQGELASREAEIALLKRSLLDAEADAAAPQPSPTAQAAEPVALLVRKNSWRDGQWEATPFARSVEAEVRRQDEPLTEAQVQALIEAKHFRSGYELKASDQVCLEWYRLGLRDGERAHGIKGGQHVS